MVQRAAKRHEVGLDRRTDRQVDHIPPCTSILIIHLFEPKLYWLAGGKDAIRITSSLARYDPIIPMRVRWRRDINADIHPKLPGLCQRQGGQGHPTIRVR